MTRYRLLSVALVVAVAIVTGCSRTAAGAGEFSDDRGPAPLVKNDQVDALLPTDAEIQQIMERPGMTIRTRVPGLQSLPRMNLSEPKCVAVIFGILEPTYRGSDYQRASVVIADDPGTLYIPDLMLGATSFADPEAAQRFVDAQTATWAECADRPLVDRIDAEAAFTWVTSPPAVTDGVRTTTRTLERLDGYGCTRALASRSNVVADADVCAADAETSAPEAAAMVDLVLERIGT